MTEDAAIGWGGLALSLLLVGVAVVLSWWRGLRLERELLWASARALAQLLAVGLVLVVVVEDDSPVALAWAWVVAMVVMAAFTEQHRSHTEHPDVPNLLPLALVATGLSSLVGLGVVFGLGVY
jgi:putative ABC transport system permease protein